MSAALFDRRNAPEMRCILQPAFTLSNAVDRAKIMSDDLTIRLESLPPEIREHVPGRLLVAGSDADLTALKKAHIVEVLRREQGNKTTAAVALGVSRRSLYRLLEKYEIEV